ELSELFLDYADNGVVLELELHKHALKLLDNGNVDEAWKTLLTFNLG
ncbi:MAG: flavin reductase family protein, partial [Flavobacteriales bacterium]|nr:flavin reductase family protein [Flavobacteriales bacterium]